MSAWGWDPARRRRASICRIGDRAILARGVPRIFPTKSVKRLSQPVKRNATADLLSFHPRPKHPDPGPALVTSAGMRPACRRSREHGALSGGLAEVLMGRQADGSLQRYLNAGDTTGTSYKLCSR
jgi:hypothetical protein